MGVTRTLNIDEMLVLRFILKSACNRNVTFKAKFYESGYTGSSSSLVRVGRPGYEKLKHAGLLGRKISVSPLIMYDALFDLYEDFLDTSISSEEGVVVNGIGSGRWADWGKISPAAFPEYGIQWVDRVDCSNLLCALFGRAFRSIARVVGRKPIVCRLHMVSGVPVVTCITPDRRVDTLYASLSEEIHGMFESATGVSGFNSLRASDVYYFVSRGVASRAAYYVRENGESVLSLW